MPPGSRVAGQDRTTVFVVRRIDTRRIAGGRTVSRRSRPCSSTIPKPSLKRTVTGWLRCPTASAARTE
jgi:hypothetical protein